MIGPGAPKSEDAAVDDRIAAVERVQLVLALVVGDDADLRLGRCRR